MYLLRQLIKTFLTEPYSVLILFSDQTSRTLTPLSSPCTVSSQCEHKRIHQFQHFVCSSTHTHTHKECVALFTNDSAPSPQGRLAFTPPLFVHTEPSRCRTKRSVTVNIMMLTCVCLSIFMCFHLLNYIGICQMFIIIWMQ